MTWLKRALLATLLLCSGFVGAASEQIETGSLTIVGSDTLSRLMTEWTEAFYTRYPSISVEVQAVGSAAAPPALQHGTANIGSMSRPMNADERSGFVATRGYPPTEIAIASDTVVLITHPSNLWIQSHTIRWLAFLACRAPVGRVGEYRGGQS